MIYIHIPFCRQKCSYCDFHFSTSLALKEEVISCIKRELLLRKDELEDKTLSSVYFGGGTPSLLSVDEIRSLVDEVSKYFSLDRDIEISLEANPDDLDKFFLKELSSSPVNRVSIGVQSFFDEDLRLMRRLHSGVQAEDSVKRAQDFGFKNLSIDLIYGYSPMEVWKENLQKAVALDVAHISSYALTIEPKTELSYLVRKNKIAFPDEGVQREKFFFLSDFLGKHHYEHYEISNFSKPNYHSRHNTSYWQQKAYLGLGPSAHSYNGRDRRSWNISNNALYVKKINAGEVFYESESLSVKERFNEMIMTGLRTARGVNLRKLEMLFGTSFREILEKNAKYELENGALEVVDHHLKINKEHLFLADGLASHLFLV